MNSLEFLTAIGGTKSLSTLDGYARAIWADWGEGRLTDEQASALAEALEARKREVRGIDTVASRAPQVAALAKGEGRPSHFPPKRKAARSPDRRASIERRRTLAASGPMPPRLASRFTTGGARRPAHRRRCNARSWRLFSDPGGDRRAGRGVRHHGQERFADGRARRTRDHRGAAARQAAEPRQCGACGVAGVEDVDRAERQTKRASARRLGREGRVQKSRGHGYRFFQNLTWRPRFTRPTFQKCPSRDAIRHLAADIALRGFAAKRLFDESGRGEVR